MDMVPKSSGVLLGPTSSSGVHMGSTVGSPRTSFSCLQPEAPAAETSGLQSSIAGGFGGDEDVMGIDPFFCQPRLEDPPASIEDLAAAFDNFDDGLPFRDELDFVPPPNEEDYSFACSGNSSVLSAFPALNLNCSSSVLQPPPYALNRTRRAVINNRRSSLPLYDPRAAPSFMYQPHNAFDSFDLGLARPHSWTSRDGAIGLQHPYNGLNNRDDNAFVNQDLLGAGWVEDRSFNCVNSSSMAAAVSNFNGIQQPAAMGPSSYNPAYQQVVEGSQNGYGAVHRTAPASPMVYLSSNLSRLKTTSSNAPGSPLGRSISISANDMPSAGDFAAQPDFGPPPTAPSPPDGTERVSSLPSLSRLRTTSLRTSSYSDARNVMHTHSTAGGLAGPVAGPKLSIRSGGVSKSQSLSTGGTGSRPETPRTPTVNSPSAAAAASLLNNRNVPSFGDLVNHGYMTPGHHSFTVGNIEGVEVEVDTKGNIHWGGVVHLSLSSFALAVLKDRNPDRRACDGWREVRYNGQKLVILRKACLQKMVELGEV